MGKKSQRNQQRSPSSFERRKPKREPYDRVLIVCEDSKSAPKYLEDLKIDLRLSSMNIKICGKECGSDPESVVDYAIKLYKKDHDYDCVYCVFDRDTHTSFAPALDKIKGFKPRKGHQIVAIPSIPCFEFWLLLHFQYTTKQFAETGNKSICDNLIDDLKKHLPGYNKGMEDVYPNTRKYLSTAIDNAKKVEEYHKTSGTDHPSTQVHCLVEYLQKLKNSPATKTV